MSFLKPKKSNYQFSKGTVIRKNNFYKPDSPHNMIFKQKSAFDSPLKLHRKSSAFLAQNSGSFWGHNQSVLKLNKKFSEKVDSFKKH